VLRRPSEPALTIGQRQRQQDRGNPSFAQALKTLRQLANPLYVEGTAACRGKRRANRIGGRRITLN